MTFGLPPSEHQGGSSFETFDQFLVDYFDYRLFARISVLFFTITYVAATEHPAPFRSHIPLKLWDTICTFPKEVELIWKARWTWGKALYLWVRYSQIIVFGAYLFYWTLPKLEWKRNKDILGSAFGLPGEKIFLRIWFQLGVQTIGHNLLLVFSLTAAEALMVLRIRAIWASSRRAKNWITGGFIAFAVVSIVMATVGYPPLVVFILLAIFHMTMICLTWIKIASSPQVRGSETRLVRMVFRDGMLYYALVYCFSIAEIAVWAVSLRSTDDWAIRRGFLTLIQRGIQLLSWVIATRITLSLKEAGARTVIIDGIAFHPSTNQAVHMSNLSFAAPDGSPTPKTSTSHLVIVEDFRR